METWALGNRTRGHDCYIITDNLYTLHIGHKALCGDEFKSSILINLVEEISRQQSIQALEWLLLADFREIDCVNQK